MTLEGSPGTPPLSIPKPSRNLSWYVKRLRVMGPAEVVYRVAEQCTLKILEVQHRTNRTRANSRVADIGRFSFCSNSARQLPTLPWSFMVTEDAAEKILTGQLCAMGHEWTWKPDSSVWHEAPDTHREWPRLFFSRIPYREGNPYGDVRIAWEPSRMQQLITLGLLAQRSGSDIRHRAVVQLEAQFLSWVEANPFLTGIHYISVMECGLRILAVCHAIDLVREWLQDAAQIWSALVDLIENHARLIHKRLSVHSSTGNHTVAEAAALVYVGSLFPEMSEAMRWRSVGLALLEKEATHQILTDGGGSEQSFWYLRFVSDLYGLVTMLLRHQRQDVPSSIEDAFQRSQFFLQNVSVNGLGLPRIGDGDNGYALSPFLQFNGPNEDERKRCVTFAASGYSVIRSGLGSEQQQLIFDHGSLGMAPCYAHGHADALAVTFHVGRHEVLLDPGTYTYTGPQQWRKYFRGTSAHNTITVDGLDQAAQETAFLWAEPFRCVKIHKEEHSDGTVMIVSGHDGYSKRVGVMHWRGVLYHPPALWLICDRLIGAGEHSLALNWHLGIEPIVSGDGYAVQCGSEVLYLGVDGGAVSTLHSGEEHPISGWYSSHYGVKEPIFTLQTTYTGMLPHEFVTHVRMGADATPIASHVSILRRFIDEAQTC